ncbi:hypothetical protein FB451DRAFT_1182936 [Mycena latifolia]|nr:hypothetical protein FB451DRAFT_1182936 [Mycena latifolia]
MISPTCTNTGTLSKPTGLISQNNNQNPRDFPMIITPTEAAYSAAHSFNSRSYLILIVLSNIPQRCREPANLKISLPNEDRRDTISLSASAFAPWGFAPWGPSKMLGHGKKPRSNAVLQYPEVRVEQSNQYNFRVGYSSARSCISAFLLYCNSFPPRTTPSSHSTPPQNVTRILVQFSLQVRRCTACVLAYMSSMTNAVASVGWGCVEARAKTARGSVGPGNNRCRVDQEGVNGEEERHRGEKVAQLHFKLGLDCNWLMGGRESSCSYTKCGRVNFGNLNGKRTRWKCFAR